MLLIIPPTKKKNEVEGSDDERQRTIKQRRNTGAKIMTRIGLRRGTGCLTRTRPIAMPSSSTSSASQKKIHSFSWRAMVVELLMAVDTHLSRQATLKMRPRHKRHNSRKNRMSLFSSISVGWHFTGFPRSSNGTYVMGTTSRFTASAQELMFSSLLESGSRDSKYRSDGSSDMLMIFWGNWEGSHESTKILVAP